MIKFLLLFNLIIHSSVVLATDVYRIVDENGRVLYSQIPPTKDAEKVKIQGVKSSSNITYSTDQASSTERQERYSNYLEAERLERKQKREQIQQEKAELASNCYSVRADLEDMKQGGMIYYDLDKNGERVYIDENRVQEKKQRLQNYLAKNCKSILNN